MSVKLTELSKKTGLATAELRQRLKVLGADIKPQTRVINDDMALLLEEELKKNISTAVVDIEDEEKKDTAKIYEEFIEKELDKEIVKTQRKLTAGKDAVKTKKTAQPAAQRPQLAVTEIEIPDAITVKEFAEKTGLNPVKVIGELMKNGILANINQTIDFETASIIADDFSIKLKRKRAAVSAQDISMGNLEMLIKEKDEAELVQRAPIVTVMGHVDHGKTKLLDAIRETDVVSTEAGGITQHIGAYQVEKNGRPITFIDTPGHEAFASMRARGAKITDIVILVVAADEGIKPQTIEALNHAKEADVPIIVAINKIDKEGSNVDRVKAQLAEQGLQPENWGGKTIMTPVSALTGEGIPMLLEMILLVAEMENLKANPNRPAVATVLEAILDKNLGPVATVIINTGTLRLQDPFVIGDICGRVKVMKNHQGLPLKTALPSTPVRIAGLEKTPHAGDILQIVGSLEEARKKAEQIKLLRESPETAQQGLGIEQIMSAIQAGKLKTLKVVLKADTLGSIEAIKQAISQVKKDEVSVKIIHSAVGAVNGSDVMMAAAASGIVISFNTLPTSHVKNLAEKDGVQIFTYQIIYSLVEDLKKILSGLLEPEVVKVTLGHAEVRQIFLTQKKTIIIGCKVIDGRVENKARVRVLRGDQQIGEGIIASLKRNNDAVQEVGEGNDCGIKFEGDVKFEEKDVLEVWKEERKTRIVT